MSKSITVKVRLICEKFIDVDINIPIEGLTPDGEGIYSFDEIQGQAEALALDLVAANGDFDSVKMDEAVITDCPDDLEYWC